MILIGNAADGISLYLATVATHDNILSVIIRADGTRVRAEGKTWEPSAASSAEEDAEIARSAHPGDRVLLPFRPVVELRGEQLKPVRDNFARISGTKAPWEAEWRFQLPEHFTAHDSLSISIPSIEETMGRPIYAAAFWEVLTP
ncbi:hypothetical protein [Flexivirga caeni]|uniref:hypothetical protein n=1 Tax=Flexivirga caeni TaxID=2294115 RepID=UPI0011CDA140|nr:hypothetical protein [Flexivirga caeni]